MACNSHFANLEPSLSGYKVSKHLIRELDNYQEVIEKILAGKTAYFTELHKFEEKIGDLSIFRAKINKIHIVYAVNKEKNVLFLRAFKNFNLYEKFLESKKDIKKIADSIK